MIQFMQLSLHASQSAEDAISNLANKKFHPIYILPLQGL